MREPIEIKLPASFTAATARLHRPGSPRNSTAPARHLKPAPQPHLTRRPGAAPRRAAY